MARGLGGWSYRDVCRFLTAHGFRYEKQLRGSHERWRSADGTVAIELNRIKGGDTYPRRAYSERRTPES